MDIEGILVALCALLTVQFCLIPLFLVKKDMLDVCSISFLRKLGLFLLFLSEPVVLGSQNQTA